jgi:pyruvate/2-oxoglutarate dehydrogenase complex dihydrolipoamide acyltransferase (E2) component
VTNYNKKLTMRIPIVVPDLKSESEPIRVSGWLVDEGDLVLAGDLVVEVLLPGITFDVTAEATGRLIEISKLVDAEIRIGEILGWIEGTTDENMDAASYDGDDVP